MASCAALLPSGSILFVFYRIRPVSAVPDFRTLSFLIVFFRPSALLPVFLIPQGINKCRNAAETGGWAGKAIAAIPLAVQGGLYIEVRKEKDPGRTPEVACGSVDRAYGSARMKVVLMGQ